VRGEHPGRGRWQHGVLLVALCAGGAGETSKESDLQPFSLSPPRRSTCGYCAVSQAFSVLLLTIVSTIYANLDRTCCHVPSSSNHLIFRTRATAPHSASGSASDPCYTCCCRFLCPATSGWSRRPIAHSRLPLASTTNGTPSVARTSLELALGSLSSGFRVECSCWTAFRAFCLHVLSDRHPMRRNPLLEGVAYLFIRVYTGCK
jgi:hypothetical protein